MRIQPLPLHIGYGFSCSEQLNEEEAKLYEFKQEDIYFNYFYKDCYKLPWLPYHIHENADLFSPNLNKELHVGHLRNLVLASALSCLPTHSFGHTLYGTTLGEIDGQREAVQELMKRFGIQKHRWIFSDDTNFIPKNRFKKGSGETEGCLLYNDVVVVRSDGRPTYSFYELGFAQDMKISHYLTGSEQIDHFSKLGLGDKHLPMGLVLGSNGKKLASRDGSAMLAQQFIETIEQSLSGKNTFNVATAIIALNFLLTARTTNIKLDISEWTNYKNKGMYIVYNYARAFKVLSDCPLDFSSSTKSGRIEPLNSTKWGIPPRFERQWALMSYTPYYQLRSIKTFDPVHLTQHLHVLAQEVASLYESEQVKWGESDVIITMHALVDRMQTIFTSLGIKEVTTTE